MTPKRNGPSRAGGMIKAKGISPAADLAAAPPASKPSSVASTVAKAVRWISSDAAVPHISVRPFACAAARAAGMAIRRFPVEACVSAKLVILLAPRRDRRSSVLDQQRVRMRPRFWNATARLVEGALTVQTDATAPTPASRKPAI